MVSKARPRRRWILWTATLALTLTILSPWTFLTAHPGIAPLTTASHPLRLRDLSRHASAAALSDPSRADDWEDDDVDHGFLGALKNMAKLAVNAALLFAVYSWLFRGGSLRDALLKRYPAWAPLLRVKFLAGPFLLRRVLPDAMSRSLSTLAGWTNSAAARHLLLAAKEPLSAATEAVLLVAATNFAVQLLPPALSLEVPRQLALLAGASPKATSALSLKASFAEYSVHALRCVLVTCACAFLLKAKQPPRQVDSRKARGLSWYWLELSQRRGSIVLADLALSALALAYTAGHWFELFGVDPKKVVAVGGAGGLAVSLASQNLVGNAISGLLIRITRPFRPGDHIELDKAKGIVRSIGWNFTELETVGGPVVLLPNANVAKGTIVNQSRGDVRAVKLEVPVKFPTGGFDQISELQESIRTLLQQQPLCKARLTKPPAVRFSASGSSKLVVSLELLNVGLEGTDQLESEATVAVVQHLRSKGYIVPGLEV